MCLKTSTHQYKNLNFFEKYGECVVWITRLLEHVEKHSDKKLLMKRSIIFCQPTNILGFRFISNRKIPLVCCLGLNNRDYGIESAELPEMLHQATKPHFTTTFLVTSCESNTFSMSAPPAFSWSHGCGFYGLTRTRRVQKTCLWREHKTSIGFTWQRHYQLWDG